MLTITRRLALQLKSVMRRAFGRNSGPAVCFTVNAGTLSVKAKCGDVAVEHRAPIDAPDETLWLPFQCLADCEAKKDDPVRLEATGKGKTTAQWNDKSVPQLVAYDCEAPRDADKLPVLPETFAENAPTLLDALHEACETCDVVPGVRFAVDCVELSGAKGRIAGTDGRQLLVQSGFQFPWTEDHLVPHCQAFASPELPRDQPVRIGKSGNWVAVAAGPWTIYLAVHTDGRFPELEKYLPKPEDVPSRCRFSQRDAEFLLDALPKLPGNSDHDRPITLDLKGQVAVRSKSADSDKPTEVVLIGSSRSGKSIRTSINRMYLIRALRLGFREVDLVNNEETLTLTCSDERRHYVWTPLHPTSAVHAAKDAIRIEPPAAGDEPEIPVTETQPEQKSPMSETTAPNNQTTGNQAQANGHATKASGQVRKPKTKQRDITALIEQAIKLRADAGELIVALKRHRRENRAVQQTLQQIRTLKGLGV